MPPRPVATVARSWDFGGKSHFVGQDFRFHFMFHYKIFWPQKIYGDTKSRGDICPRMSPLATGLVSSYEGAGSHASIAGSYFLSSGNSTRKIFTNHHFSQDLERRNWSRDQLVTLSCMMTVVRITVVLDKLTFAQLGLCLLADFKQKFGVPYYFKKLHFL